MATDSFDPCASNSWWYRIVFLCLLILLKRRRTVATRATRTEPETLANAQRLIHAKTRFSSGTRIRLDVVPRGDKSVRSLKNARVQKGHDVVYVRPENCRFLRFFTKLRANDRGRADKKKKKTSPSSGNYPFVRITTCNVYHRPVRRRPGKIIAAICPCRDLATRDKWQSALCSHRT